MQTILVNAEPTLPVTAIRTTRTRYECECGRRTTKALLLSRGVCQHCPTNEEIVAAAMTSIPFNLGPFRPENCVHHVVLITDPIGVVKAVYGDQSVLFAEAPVLNESIGGKLPAHLISRWKDMWSEAYMKGRCQFSPPLEGDPWRIACSPFEAKGIDHFRFIFASKTELPAIMGADSETVQ